MEISKNLLQMNFMRKTALAAEKNSVEESIECVDPDKWTVQLPDFIKNHLKKAVAMKPIIKKSREIPIVHTAHSVENIPPGGRFSFGRFNPAIEKLMASSTLPDSSNEVSVTESEMAAIKEVFRHQKRSAESINNADENDSNISDPEEGEVIQKKHRKRNRRKQNSNAK